MVDATGQADLRAENVDRIVKGFAGMSYRFKELVMISSSNSWIESYYQETSTELTGGLGSSIKGIPRLAAFPYGEPTWTKKSSYQVKHGMEGVVSYEDILTDNIDVIARTLMRIARAVAASVDQEIYNALSENDTPATINTLALTAGYEWDSATIANRDPVQDILNAKKLIEEDNYDFEDYPGQGFLAVSPKDAANLLGNSSVRNAGQFYTDEVTRNGVIGRILGLKVVKSNRVTADKAMVGIGKICATWKPVTPLTTVTIDDPGVKKTVRAWEIGTTQLTNPQSICLITNTQA
jgi:hypothetical protein